jgi:hypothetical protein
LRYEEHADLPPYSITPRPPPARQTSRCPTFTRCATTPPAKNGFQPVCPPARQPASLTLSYGVAAPAKCRLYTEYRALDVATAEERRFRPTPAADNDTIDVRMSAMSTAALKRVLSSFYRH